MVRAATILDAQTRTARRSSGRVLSILTGVKLGRRHKPGAAPGKIVTYGDRKA